MTRLPTVQDAQGSHRQGTSGHTDVRGSGMTVYDDVCVEFRQPSSFDTGDPVAVFEDLRVYVEFDSSDHGRRPVEEKFPGHPGEWICVYSSLERLRDMHGEDIEYSCVLG